jgi:hypothetical protein
MRDEGKLAMNHRSQPILLLVLISSLIPHPSSLARADGGAVRLSEQKGNYRITVFTAPTPLRTGPVDISVLVQNAATGELASGVRVTIKAERQGSPSDGVLHSATTEAATNKLYHVSNFDLPEPGRYSLEVRIDGDLGEAQVAFELQAAEPLPRWLAMWPWVAWPVLAILLFSIHQLLVRRRAR